MQRSQLHLRVGAIRSKDMLEAYEKIHMYAERGAICTPFDYFPVYVKTLNEKVLSLYLLIDEGLTEDYLAAPSDSNKNAKNYVEKTVFRHPKDNINNRLCPKREKTIKQNTI